MRWQKISDCCFESDSGYRISKYPRGHGARYLAWAPVSDPGPRKARYARGEPIPRPYHCLGPFDELGPAQAACRAHAREHAKRRDDHG